MVGVVPAEGFHEPLPRLRGQQGKHEGEIGVVFGPVALGFQQQLYFRAQVGKARGCVGDHVTQGQADIGVAVADPLGTRPLIEHDLQAPWLPGPGPAPDAGGGGFHRGRGPRCEDTGVRPMEVPPRQEAVQERGVFPKDRDVDVAVRPRGVPHEEIEGMASGHPPGEAGPGEQRLDVRERQWGPRTLEVGRGRQDRSSFSLVGVGTTQEFSQMINFCICQRSAVPERRAHNEESHVRRSLARCGRPVH